MLTFERAHHRNILSLQNWVAGNACLDREETEYLAHCKDLITLASIGDMGSIESWVEDKLIRYYRDFRKV